MGRAKFTMDRLLAAICDLLAAAVPAGFRIATHVVPLSEVQQTWADTGRGPRVVFRVG
jgi:hypothetical protein